MANNRTNDVGTSALEMKFRLSRSGLVSAIGFLCYCSYFLWLFVQGAGQAPIFIFLATLPVSLLVNPLVDWLQISLHWADPLRVNAELALSICLGIVLYYAIGHLIGIYVKKLS